MTKNGGNKSTAMDNDTWRPVNRVIYSSMSLMTFFFFFKKKALIFGVSLANLERGEKGVYKGREWANRN